MGLPVCFLGRRVIKALPLGWRIGSTFAVHQTKITAQSYTPKIAGGFSARFALLLQFALLVIHQES